MAGDAQGDCPRRPTNTAPYYPAFLREFFAGPASLTVELSASPVRDEVEIEATITALARESGGGLIVATGAFINTRRRLIMALAERPGQG